MAVITPTVVSENCTIKIWCKNNRTPDDCENIVNLVQSCGAKNLEPVVNWAFEPNYREIVNLAVSTSMQLD